MTARRMTKLATAIWRNWKKPKKKRGWWRTGCVNWSRKATKFGTKTNDAERAVEWRDMAVLLRAPANKAEAYAKEFERAGVPLARRARRFLRQHRNRRFAEPAQAARQSVAGRAGHRRAALAAGWPVAG